VARDWQGSVVDRSGEITHVNPAPEQSFHFFLTRALNTRGSPHPLNLGEKLSLSVLLIDRNGITYLIMSEEQDLLRALRHQPSEGVKGGACHQSGFS
jgi:hypothetical protein